MRAHFGHGALLLALSMCGACPDDDSQPRVSGGSDGVDSAAGIDGAEAGSSGAGASGGSGARAPKAGTSAAAGSQASGTGGRAANGGSDATSEDAGVGSCRADCGAGDGDGPISQPGVVDCDPRKVTCKRTPPSCGQFQVPSVDGSCYGPCAGVEACRCTGPEECPQPEEYTCLLSARHCTPYL